MPKMTHQGPFETSSDYKKHLISQGYKDWGWQNGWNDAKSAEYQNTISLSEIKSEDIQWNNSGSDYMYVYHDLKLFSSVDMGD